MTPAQRNRHAALLKASGFEDAPALTVQSTDGEIPQGRELSFAWLTGTVMTGLTSVLLMGAALYVSFKGQDTFSTAYEALQVITGPQEVVADSGKKGDRLRPIAKTTSELEIVEASIRETVDGRAMIRKQPFVRIRASLATAATALSGNIPAYDPVALLDTATPVVDEDEQVANPEIYGAEVEGEVLIRTETLPADFVPTSAITDQAAASFVRATVENLFAEGGEYDVALAYAAEPGALREIGAGTVSDLGIVENVTVMGKSKDVGEAGPGRSERVVTVRGEGFRETLLKNGFDENTFGMVTRTLRNVLGQVIESDRLPAGVKLRIQMGPSRTSDDLIPYRLSIYSPVGNGTFGHLTTAALTDRGNYVIGQEPPMIQFPEEDTEQVDVNNLPSVYRSIWETARKHDVDDAITSRIVAMFAYDIDLTRRISAGDSIEILQTEPDGDGHQELLYVSLKLGSTTRELFRFRTDDGTVEYYDPEGQTGKRFLVRRPLEGGGRLSSRFGGRVHPIFKSRRQHTGVDLAAPRNTPIYAAGDGVVEKAQWMSGYGRYVEIKHVNGYETAYGHMNKIADSMKPGVRVKQGQIIGYVGSTGNSTGNHLHFEIKVNGRFVDPLSVKLPRDRSLSAQYDQAFRQTIAQIRDLMQREAAPITVASLQQ